MVQHARHGGRGKVVVAVALLGLVATACGSSSKSNAGGSSTLPASPTSQASGATGKDVPVEVAFVNDFTGNISANIPHEKAGTDAALKDLQAAGILNGYSIHLTDYDSASTAATAANEGSKAIASNAAAILGPYGSANGLAIAPLVAKAGIPTLFPQGNAPEILAGPNIYATSVPVIELYKQVPPQLTKEGAKSVAIVYDSDSPAFASLGGKLLPQLFQGAGFAITTSQSLLITDQNVAPVAQKLAQSKPDAVVMFVVGPQNGAMINALRQAGFGGDITCNLACGSGSISSVGSTVPKVWWPVPYNYSLVNSINAAFLKSYQPPKGYTEPNSYAGEAYDAMWMLGLAIQKGGGPTRENIAAGLKAIAATGYDGARGRVTFNEHNQAQTSGVLVEWQNNTEQPFKG